MSLPSISLFAKSLPKSLVALVLLSPLVGCSSFKPKLQDVRIDTDPSGLPVKVDGVERGNSPLVIKLDRNVSHTIIASDTNKVYVRELNRKMSNTGTLDMVGASMFMPIGLGLLTPGAWELESQVMMQMSDIPTTRPSTMPATSPNAVLPATQPMKPGTPATGVK